MVVPVWTNLLSDGDCTIRIAAAAALGGFGEHAHQAVPKLVRLLNDPIQDVGLAAANALKAIDPEAAARAGVK